MDYEKLIHEFVDGTIDQASEDKLFMAISSNEELRSELKMQMAMKSAISSDTKAATPTARSTMNIFNELGFTAPVPAPVPTGVFTKIGSFLSKYSQGLIGGAIAAGTVAAVMLLWMRPDGSGSGNSNFTARDGGNHTISQQANIPVSSSSDITKELASIAYQEKIARESRQPEVIYKYIYVDRNKTEETKQPAPVEIAQEIETKPATKDLSALFESSIFKPTDDYFKSSIMDNNTGRMLPKGSDLMSFDGPILPESYYMINNKLGLSFEFRGSQYWFLDEENISPSKIQKFNNTGISLLYAANDNWRFGLEYRRENFFQRFKGIDDNNNLFQYEQQPNFETWSVLARYSTDFRWSILRPFVQAGAGFNKAGSVGRFMLGAEVSPNPGYTFIIGVDGSMMAYHHQSRSYWTGKIGVLFGVGFNF